MLPVTCSFAAATPSASSRCACSTVCTASTANFSSTRGTSLVRACIRNDFADILPLTSMAGTPRSCATPMRFGQNSDSATTSRRGLKRPKKRATTNERSTGSGTTRWPAYSLRAAASPVAVNAEITSGVPGWSRSRAATSGRSTATSPADEPCSQMQDGRPGPSATPKRCAKSRRPVTHRRYTSHGDKTMHAMR